MTKIFKTIIPVILSILTIYGLLEIEAVLRAGKLGIETDLHFDSGFQLVLILTMIAILIQTAFTLPTWNYFRKAKKFLKLTLRQFFTILCVILGISFGFLFWARNLGIQDFFIACLIGFVLSAIYWTVNLVTLNQLEKWTEKNKNGT
jgi:Kef-type K+ transport system membrane component KefB